MSETNKNDYNKKIYKINEHHLNSNELNNIQLSEEEIDLNLQIFNQSQCLNQINNTCIHFPEIYNDLNYDDEKVSEFK